MFDFSENVIRFKAEFKNVKLVRGSEIVPQVTVRYVDEESLKMGSMINLTYLA